MWKNAVNIMTVKRKKYNSAEFQKERVQSLNLF